VRDWEPGLICSSLVRAGEIVWTTSSTVVAQMKGLGSAGDNLIAKPTLDMERMHSTSHKLCFAIYGTH